MLLVLLLGVAIIFALHTLVRIWMHYLRLRTVHRLRRQTLAEHSRFLRRLDHELKNPLTTLRAGLKALALTGLDPQQAGMVETMEADTVRLSRLVADLRKLADMEAQPLNNHPFDLHAFLQHVMQVQQERFAEGRRQLQADSQAAAQDDWVGDEDLLALALHNLLDNAFKHTGPGDAVRLTLAVDHDLVITVADTGSGIPAEHLPHIWEELYRVEQTQKIPGSGIGLALVKAIVERHNGDVSVESAPGQGTTVTLRLPPLPRD